MVIRWLAATAVAIVCFTTGCDDRYQKKTASNDHQQGEYVWQVPQGFPIPMVPADNPMTLKKVALGRQLFHDTRLSGDGSISCASCHQPQRAFTDGNARAKGIQGHLHPRSAMSLVNVAYNATLGWDNPTLTRLEDQIRIPLFNMQPPEMGATGREAAILSRLRKDPRMRAFFHSAFPDEPSPVTMRNVIYAIAAYERTLISGDSPYDRWAFGADPNALSKAARAGARLFFSNRLQCFRCHAGFNLSGPVKYVGSQSPKALFHNTALYNENGRGVYPEPNTGLFRHTGVSRDMGKFRAPTLRNIALTAPYMHDGSIATLEEVLDHYAAGGRARLDLQSVRSSSGNVDPLMVGFVLASEEKQHLIAFLHALTDPAFIKMAVAEQIASKVIR